VSGGLAVKAFRGLSQTFLGNFVRVGLQFAVGVMLARILGPDSFGLVAIALLIVGLGGLIMDAGISSSLIQKDVLNDEDIAWAFYAQILIGLTLTILGWLSSSIIANFLGNQAAAPLLGVISLTFLVRAFGQTSLALLNRKMQFGMVQAISVGTYLSGYAAVGLAAALSGLGAWSIIAAHLTQTTLAAVAQLSIARPSLRLRKLRPPAGLLSFGWKATTAGFLSWTFYNIDSFLVARLNGQNSLGLYNRSITLVNIPIVGVASIQSVIFSISSRIQKNAEKATVAYLACISAISASVVPVLFLVTANSQIVVNGILGDEWGLARYIVTPLSLAVAINAYSYLAGPVLTARNAIIKEIWALVFANVLMIIVFPIATQASVFIAAWTLVPIYAFRAILVTYAVVGTLKIQLRRVAWAIFTPILLMTPVPMALAWMTRQLTEPWPAEWVLIAIIGASAVGWIGSLVIAGPLIAKGPLGEAISRTGMFPAYLEHWLFPEKYKRE